MILVGKTYEERLRCCKVSLSTGCAQYGVDMSMFQNELLVDRLMAIAENKLLNIPDQEKEAQRQVSLHAIRGLNGTVNMSTSPQISQAELLVDLAKDTLLSFPDLEKDALRQGSLAATAGFNATTDMSALPQISQTAVPMVGGPGLFGGALMALLIVTALLALGCSICFLKGLDRKPASSPQQAKENKKLGRSRHALGSASSLGVSEGMMRPPPCSAASLASARSYASRATRDSCAGRLLSARVRGRDVGGSPNGAGALGLGTTPGGAPATKMFSFEGQRASINSAQRLNKAWYTPSPQAGDSRFTVPVDTLVNVAAQGGFDIKDVGSGLVLRVSLRRNDDGHRVLQTFQGLPHVAQRPCMTVGPPKPHSSSDPDSLVICGPNGLIFGNIILQCTGSFLVSAQGQPFLLIEGNEADLDLHISTIRDGRLVGAVCCNDANFSGQEHVEFRVMPGTDPVLVVSCIAAVLFLCGDDDGDDSGT
mmetsp:Transcript_29053/g.77324  ORF Transcript_29053/g.77324 Transcript_29053/m.77324 type:complete len:480 (-) Transcript_29053:357-1796(-)